MKPTPVSVYIIAKNEAQRIRRAVESASRWADEVIVVDSGSQDDTVAIAESAGARVLYREWTGYGPQKKFAEDQCRNDWVLNLDADEEITPELARELQAAIDRAPTQQAAFRVRVTDLLPGEQTPRWFAYSYHILRLYNRRRASMSSHAYQDRIEVRNGTVTNLRGRILHRSFISWETTVQKINFYTTQVGRQRREAGRCPSKARIWLEFPATFLKVWIVRRYALRGLMGFSMAITVAWLNLLRLLKTVENPTDTAPLQTDKSSQDDHKTQSKAA